jgi:hypothetical protein
MTTNNIIDYCNERSLIRERYFTPDTENSYLNSRLIQTYPDIATIKDIGKLNESCFVYAILCPDRPYTSHINYQRGLTACFKALITKPENQKKLILLYDYITEVYQLTINHSMPTYIHKNVTTVYNLIKDYRQTQIKQLLWY